MRSETFNATVIRFGDAMTGAKLDGDVVVEVPRSCVDFEANTLARGLREYIATAVSPRPAAGNAARVLYRIV